jgi:hypothetical protein
MYAPPNSLDDDSLLAECRRLNAINQWLPVLLLLLHCEQPAATGTVVSRGIDIGFRQISKWNVSASLGALASKGFVAQLAAGWKISPTGIRELKERGCKFESRIIQETRHGLKTHVDRVKSTDRRRFLEEALICLDAKAFRAAIVLSWVGAIHILHVHVQEKHLANFNAAGLARFPKNYIAAKSATDFARLKEADFLQVCEDASVFGKAEKQELQERLGLRNRCGHPNSLKFAEHAAAAHIETLISSVYEKY